jgi:sterol desaturase/sphingolipid hydroxylase (fatty acid hydroxylase superfamily)
MEQLFTNNESILRLTAFFSTLFVIILFERLMHFRESAKGLKHAGTNLSLAIINTILLRIILPTGLIAIALFSSSRSLGMFNVFQTPLYIEIPISIVLFDCLIYWQHRLMHKSNLLWQLHKVHHSDQFIDFSTGLRFHPLEIIFSFVIKVVIVLLLGLNPLSIIIFEIALNSLAIFNHGNIKLNSQFEPILRKLIITPEMHRVHHSVIRKEQDSNFGFGLTLWDSLFKSFIKPESDQSGMTFGREKNNQTIQSDSIKLILTEPFKKN